MARFTRWAFAVVVTGALSFVIAAPVLAGTGAFPGVAAGTSPDPTLAATGEDQAVMRWLGTAVFAN